MPYMPASDPAEQAVLHNQAMAQPEPLPEQAMPVPALMLSQLPNQAQPSMTRQPMPDASVNPRDDGTSDQVQQAEQLSFGHASQHAPEAVDTAQQQGEYSQAFAAGFAVHDEEHNVDYAGGSSLHVQPNDGSEARWEQQASFDGFSQHADVLTLTTDTHSTADPASSASHEQPPASNMQDPSMHASGSFAAAHAAADADQPLQVSASSQSVAEHMQGGSEQSRPSSSGTLPQAQRSGHAEVLTLEDAYAAAARHQPGQENMQQEVQLEPRLYAAIDLLVHSGMHKKRSAQFLQACRLAGLGFDMMARQGLVLNFMDGMSSGCLGVQCAAHSPQAALQGLSQVTFPPLSTQSQVACCGMLHVLFDMMAQQGSALTFMAGMSSSCLGVQCAAHTPQAALKGVSQVSVGPGILYASFKPPALSSV